MSWFSRIPRQQAMATEKELRAAAARVAEAQKQLALADRGWQLLGRSRAAFISSLRNTGLSYAHAQIKFDDFVEEQRRLYERLTQALQEAERDYAALDTAVRQAGNGETPREGTHPGVGHPVEPAAGAAQAAMTR
jgi:hypothetical protein